MRHGSIAIVFAATLVGCSVYGEQLLVDGDEAEAGSASTVSGATGAGGSQSATSATGAGRVGTGGGAGGGSDADSDGDGISDADEIAQGTDPHSYNGLEAMIGEPIGFLDSGSCNYLDSYQEMLSRFSNPETMKVVAGWEFDTPEHNYVHPDFGFIPSWKGSGASRFNLRFHGQVHLPAAGRYCFSIDTGSIGSNTLEPRRNCCGQIYLDTVQVAETGLDGNVSPHSGCLDASGWHELDIVARYRNSGVPADRLVVRYCYGSGGDCTPDQPLNTSILHAGK